MIYRTIGLMSGSSLDGLDIAFVSFEEIGGKWSYTIHEAECHQYSSEWRTRLQNVSNLSAYDYMLLHSEYGGFVGNVVNEFIEKHQLHHKIQLIASHGHTTFHAPHLKMTAQLGCGATIAAITRINTVSDLRAIDVALNGQGAPIVPLGEKILMGNYAYFLNIGGIANISAHNTSSISAFDVCPANRVLNMLAQQNDLLHDDGGAIAASGSIHTPLLTQLNSLPYYKQSFPKSLSNSFGCDEVYPLIQSFQLPLADALRTYTEHIALQVFYAVNSIHKPSNDVVSMLVTGGGAFNTFLVKRISALLQPLNIQVVVPDAQLVEYKEAVVMGLLAVLRWREENTVLHSVTGAQRNSIGGAVWMGQQA